MGTPAREQHYRRARLGRAAAVRLCSSSHHRQLRRLDGAAWRTLAVYCGRGHGVRGDCLADTDLVYGEARHTASTGRTTHSSLCQPGRYCDLGRACNHPHGLAPRRQAGYLPWCIRGCGLSVSQADGQAARKRSLVRWTHLAGHLCLRCRLVGPALHGRRLFVRRSHGYRLVQHQAHGQAATQCPVGGDASVLLEYWITHQLECGWRVGIHCCGRTVDCISFRQIGGHRHRRQNSQVATR